MQENYESQQIQINQIANRKTLEFTLTNTWQPKKQPDSEKDQRT